MASSRVILAVAALLALDFATAAGGIPSSQPISPSRHIKTFQIIQNIITTLIEIIHIWVLSYHGIFDAVGLSLVLGMGGLNGQEGPE
jgi:hypothetical protein